MALAVQDEITTDLNRWEELFHDHYQNCRQCREFAADLCIIGHIMIQFAGVHRYQEYLRRLQ